MPLDETGEKDPQMTAIDGRIYVDGQQVARAPGVLDAADRLREPGAVAWLGLMDPAPADLQTVADSFGLHPLAVEDAQKGHQRAKLERYGDTVFVVLRPAGYDDEDERVDFGEVHLFVGPRFVLTVRRGSRLDLTAAREALESEPQFLSIGS